MSPLDAFPDSEPPTIPPIPGKPSYLSASPRTRLRLIPWVWWWPSLALAFLFVPWPLSWHSRPWLLWSVSSLPPTSSDSIKLLKNRTAMVSQTTILWPPPCLCMDRNGLSLPSPGRWAVNTPCQSNSDGPILGSLSWQRPAYMQAFTAVCPRHAESLGPSALLWALHSWHAPFHVCWKNAQFFISLEMNKLKPQTAAGTFFTSNLAPFREFFFSLFVNSICFYN